MAGPVKRVCLLGAESTGKTTLARALAAAYDTVWNPSTGVPTPRSGATADAPWTSDEFTHIARIQCWYEDILAGSARGVLFCDTDAFTTAVFHEVYLGAPTHAFDDLVGGATTFTSSAGSTCRGARRDPGVRGAAALDARALSRAGARRAGRRGCCSRGHGRRERASRSRRRECRRLLVTANDRRAQERGAQGVT